MSESLAQEIGRCGDLDERLESLSDEELAAPGDNRAAKSSASSSATIAAFSASLCTVVFWIAS